MVGPAFKALADKYRNEANAPELLADTMRKGSQGRWGPVAMPPNTRLTEADSKELARWILAL
jgi:cytochrome c